MSKESTHRQTGGGQDGLSLIEVLVAMTLMLVVMAAVFGIWFGLQRTYSFTDEDLIAQEQARAAMGEMVELIRTARCPDPPPSEQLNMVIVWATPNSLICWSDVDRDPEHTLELVRFRVDPEARTLYRDTTDTPDIGFTDAHSTRLVSSWVSNDAESPLFTYTGTNGSPVEVSTVWPYQVMDPTKIREVGIDIFVDLIVDKAPVRHHLHSVVQPRNLRMY